MAEKRKTMPPVWANDADLQNGHLRDNSRSRLRSENHANPTLARREIATLELLVQKQQASEWIQSVTREKLPPGNFIEQIRDGILLSKLVNAFITDPTKKVKLVPRNPDQSINLRHAQNIFQFLEKASQLGMPKQHLFETSDLYEKKNIVKVIKCLHKFAEVMQIKGLAPSINREKEKPIKLSDFSQEEVLNSKREIAEMIRTTMKRANKTERLSIDDDFFEQEGHEITPGNTDKTTPLTDKTPGSTNKTPQTTTNAVSINNNNNNNNIKNKDKDNNNNKINKNNNNNNSQFELATIPDEEEAINALQKTLENSESEFKQEIQLKIQQAKNDILNKMQSLKEMLEQVQTRVLEDINYREAEMLNQLFEIEKQGTPKSLEQFTFNPENLLDTDPIAELLINLQLDWAEK